MRDRKEGDSLSEYLAELHCLIEHCDYRDQLEDMLRDRLVCGIKHERMQQRLLSEDDSLTLQRALAIAHSMESPIHQASMMRSAYPSNPEEFKEVRKINVSIPNLKCYRCNGRHKVNDCPFKSKECYFCKKKGQIAEVCRSKSFRNNRETNLVEEEEKEDSDTDSTDKIFNVSKLLPRDKQEQFRINLVINSMEVTMQNRYRSINWYYKL